MESSDGSHKGKNGSEFSVQSCRLNSYLCHLRNLWISRAFIASETKMQRFIHRLPR